jgi:hypothetical protein
MILILQGNDAKQNAAVAGNSSYDEIYNKSPGKHGPPTPENKKSEKLTRPTPPGTKTVVDEKTVFLFSLNTGSKSGPEPSPMRS